MAWFQSGDYSVRITSDATVQSLDISNALGTQTLAIDSATFTSTVGGLDVQAGAWKTQRDLTSRAARPSYRPTQLVDRVFSQLDERPTSHVGRRYPARRHVEPLGDDPVTGRSSEPADGGAVPAWWRRLDREFDSLAEELAVARRRE